MTRVQSPTRRRVSCLALVVMTVAGCSGSGDGSSEASTAAPTVREPDDASSDDAPERSGGLTSSGNASSSETESASPDTPTITAEPGAQVLESGFGSGDFVLADPRVGLDSLTSYHAVMQVTFAGSDGGAWSSTIDLLRGHDPALARLTVDNTGDLAAADPSLVIESGSTSYRRSDAGGCAASALDADPATSLTTLFEPAASLAAVLGGEPLGHEAIAGIDADGYGFDERAVGYAGLARASGEVWIASDGGYVVEYSIDTEGGPDVFGGDEGGTLSVEYTLADVGKPVSIEIPDDCPAALIDAPRLPDASDVVSSPGLLTYSTASSLADILAYYDQHAADFGWERAEEPAQGDTSAVVDYAVGDSYVLLFVTARDTGSRVDLVASDEPVGGDSTAGPSGTGATPGTGTATFEVSGGRSINATWQFAKQFSVFGEFWMMTFEDPSNPMPEGPFLTLMLDPDNPNLTFSADGMTILDASGKCTLELQRQDATGAAGTVICTGIDAIGSGPVNLSATFEGTA